MYMGLLDKSTGYGKCNISPAMTYILYDIINFMLYITAHKSQ